MKTTRTLATAVALAAVLPLTACGEDGSSGGEETTDFTVLAASSLTDVFTTLAKIFETEHEDVDVEFSFGSSTDLAEQAADGAPGDVIATADGTSMDLAVDAGAATDPATFATNVLVIVTPPDNPAGIESLDDLDGTTWVRCVDDAPCGRVATAVLDDAGVEAEPASLEDDVRAALDKVIAGEADAGLVYATDAVAAGDAVTAIPIEGAQDQLTSYLIAGLEQTTDDELTRAWIDLVTGEEGKAALEDAGFTLP